MKQSKQFINSQISKGSEEVVGVKSNSNPSKEYLVHKKEGEWFCTCIASQMGHKCSHIKSVTEPKSSDAKCFYCGKTAYIVGNLEGHHVERRSTAPESKMDASNIMHLCRYCHERATINNNFENNLKKLWNLRKN